jgi:hypothetical protein
MATKTSNKTSTYSNKDSTYRAYSPEQEKALKLLGVTVVRAYKTSPVTGEVTRGPSLAEIAANKATGEIRKDPKYPIDFMPWPKTPKSPATPAAPPAENTKRPITMPWPMPSLPKTPKSPATPAGNTKRPHGERQPRPDYPNELEGTANPAGWARGTKTGWGGATTPPGWRTTEGGTRTKGEGAGGGIKRQRGAKQKPYAPGMSAATPNGPAAASRQRPKQHPRQRPRQRP